MPIGIFESSAGYSSGIQDVPDVTDVLRIIVTIEKIAPTPDKIRICFRDGDGTWVENLRLSRIRKTWKPKGSQENKDFPTFQIRSSLYCDFIVWRGWRGQEENVCSNFSPRLIGFLSSLPLSAGTISSAFLWWSVWHPLHSLSLELAGEAFCRRGSEGVVKKRVWKCSGKLMGVVFFFLLCGEYT